MDFKCFSRTVHCSLFIVHTWQVSNELQKKDTLLSNFMSVATEQSRWITTLSATIQVCPAQHHSSRYSDWAASPTHLSLSNRYSTLSDYTTVHLAGVPTVLSCPDLKAAVCWHCSFFTTSVQVPHHSTGKPNQRASSWDITSSSPFQILTTLTIGDPMRNILLFNTASLESLVTEILDKLPHNHLLPNE